MAGIKDVASMAGVSTATASRALNGTGSVAESTREKVLRAARMLGYVADSSAASLASGRTRNIGVMTPSVHRWFFSAALEGVAHELMRYSYDLTLYDVSDSSQQRATVFSDLLHRGRLDALITLSFKLNPFELSGLEKLDRPVVAVGGRVAAHEPLPEWFTALQVDHGQVGRMATEHLLSLGHRQIAFLGRVDEDIEFQVSTERTRGFLQAMAAAGVEVPAAWLIPGDFTTGGAYHQVRALLEDPGARPTAVLCISDEMAIGAHMAALSLGLRVPQDVSIMGVDGHPDTARLGLSTIDQTPVQQGRRAARIVLEVLSGASAPRHVSHHLALRHRDSTAPPSGAPLLHSGSPGTYRP
ncbi:MAG: LacI family DNA-binding transcriptional regulator [Micrococcus sp.]|nr:LacI family DNA-binding transcriptional regulator [Micrococcus sp.]